MSAAATLQRIFFEIPRALVAETDAVTWLREKLTFPQRIAPLIAAWAGTLDLPTGRNLDAFMQARWTLGVEAYEGEDGRLWWRLPHETMQ